MAKTEAVIPQLMDKYHAQVLKEWMVQVAAAAKAAGVADSLSEIGARFFAALRQGINSGQFEDITSSVWAPTREILEELSRNGALRGASPSQTATFVFSLKG